MLKPWVKLFGAGIAYCFFFIGLMFGAIGKEMPAYSPGITEVIVVAMLVLVPFILGIHVGVWREKEEEHNL